MRILRFFGRFTSACQDVHGQWRIGAMRRPFRTGPVAAKQRNTLWYVCTRSKSSLTSLTGFSMIIRVLAFENDHVMEKLVLDVQGEMGLAWEKVHLFGQQLARQLFPTRVAGYAVLYLRVLWRVFLEIVSRRKTTKPLASNGPSSMSKEASETPSVCDGHFVLEACAKQQLKSGSMCSTSLELHVR